MQNATVLSRAFPARISAIESLIQALQSRTANAAPLRQAANELDRVGPMYGRASTAAVYAAFAELLRTVSMLVEWRAAVLNADVDADRFLRGAKERHRLWLAEYGATESIALLVAASASIGTASSLGEIGTICRSIASTPLPIGVFANEATGLRIPLQEDQIDAAKPDPPELAVAFLRFIIDDVAADETHFLTPGEAHDLEIEVRVSRWPGNADGLRLSPVSIEPKSSYDFPVFQFAKPSGEPPFRLHQRGRAMLIAAQGMRARPFEFRYTASFTPVAAEQPLAVVGQRTLRIEAIDVSRVSLTGYPGVDRKILQARDQLRSQPLITAADLGSVLTILTALGSLAGRALQDALFKASCREAEFHADIRNDLRRFPAIGSELDEHPKAAGGITDLSFRGIRIELKVETSTKLSVTDCRKFLGQTVSYVVGSGKRVGILCVLDNSPKQSQPIPAEEGIEVLIPASESGPVCIVTVLVQGNLARPSRLLKKA